MLNNKKILTMLDVEQGKGGSGDKEKVYVVKTSGCQKICMFLALIAIGGLAFMLVQSNKIEMQQVISRLREENTRQQGHRADVQSHEETSQHHNTLVELQNQLRQEVQEQHEDRQLSDQAIKAADDSKKQDQVMLKKFMKDLESNIHNSVDKKISEAIKSIKDEVAQEKLSGVMDEVKDSVSKKIQKVEEHINENLGSGGEKVKDLAQQFAEDAAVHGQEASSKLSAVVQMIKDKEMTLMESNSHMYELVDKNKLSEEETKIVLSNLQVRLPQAILYFTRHLDLLKNHVIPSAYTNVFFDSETVETINELGKALEKAEIAEDEVAELLNDMSKDGSIPPPADNHATVSQYIADLQKAFDETPQVRKGEQVHLDLGRFSQKGGAVTYSLADVDGFVTRTGLDVDPQTGRISGTVKDTAKSKEKVEFVATDDAGEKEAFWLFLKVYNVDETPLTRNSQEQNEASERLTKLSTLLENSQSWAIKGMTDQDMLKIVKEALKERIIHASLLFTAGEESKQAETSNKPMARDVVEWLRNGLEQMKTNSIDKASFWKEVVNKYNEGLIPADVMENFRRQMAQHMDARSHHREHHARPQTQHPPRGQKVPHAPDAKRSQVNKAHLQSRKQEAKVQQAAKESAKAETAENLRAQKRAKQIASKMKDPNLTPEEKKQLAQEMDQMKTAHTPKSQEVVQQVTAAQYQMRPLVMHEGHTVGGPWTATVAQCKQQCDITPTCLSFSFSETRQECSLKDMCVQGFAPAKPEDKRGDWMTYFKPCAESAENREQRMVDTHHQQAPGGAPDPKMMQGRHRPQQKQRPEANNPWLNQQFPNQNQQGKPGKRNNPYGQQQQGNPYGQQQQGNPYGRQQQQQNNPYGQQQQQQTYGQQQQQQQEQRPYGQQQQQQQQQQYMPQQQQQQQQL